MVFPTRAQFNATVFNQFFVLPDSIIYYISKNPISPKCYQKMVQTCKYFFVQNSIIILNKFYCDYDGTMYVYVRQKPFYLKKISTSKFWIADEFRSWSSPDFFFLRSKIYRFDAKELCLYCQTISFGDLLLFSSTVEILYFFNVTVKFNDDLIVPLEKFVSAYIKSKDVIINYHDSTSLNISSQTFKELLKIPHFLTLDNFTMWRVPEEFDIETFYTYIKKNKHTQFHLEFSQFVSEAYKNRLEEIIDEILEDENRDYKAPYICFLGLNEQKQNKLNKTCYHGRI